MSMDASGTIAGTATFSKWKGRNYVRQKVTPANPRSAAQTGVRANFAGIVALWKAHTAALTSEFETMAKQQNISAFNAFMGFNQNRLSQGKYPADNPAPTEAVPSANATGLNAVVNLKYVQLTWTDSVDGTAWANAIYRKLGADPTGLNSELIAVVPRGTELYNDGPLVPGTWHYVIRAIDEEGGVTAVSAADTAVVV